MSDYRRIYHPNGLYFFTVVTAHRRPIFDNTRAIGVLRDGFRYVMAQRPFQLEAIVIMPDHVHCSVANAGERFRFLQSLEDAQKLRDATLAGRERPDMATPLLGARDTR